MKVIVAERGGKRVSLSEADDFGGFSVVSSGSYAEVARELATLGYGASADLEGHVVIRIEAVKQMVAGTASAEWSADFERMLSYAQRKGWITEDGEAILAHVDRAPSALIPRLGLNSGHQVPQLGIGVFRVPADDTERVVSEALELGYRHFDTAAVYGNEEGVGRALRSAGIARSDLFVTTKLANDRHGADQAFAAFDESLTALGLDYVDLFLIHWPAPAFDLYVETWQALEGINRAGGAHSIGVSNLLIHHLERLLARAEIVPAVNQIELHPFLQQVSVVEFCSERGIAIEARSPLGAGQLSLFTTPAVAHAATTHERTPAQIVLRWHIQRDNIVFPKSRSVARMRENMAVFDFHLSDEEMAAITSLQRGGRVGLHPDEWH